MEKQAMSSNLSHEEICWAILSVQETFVTLANQNKVTNDEREHLRTAFVELKKVLMDHVNKK